MNIFFLHWIPAICASFHVNTHVNKMVTETAQLLSSAMPESQRPYKLTHYNHPCAVWARESKSNWRWLHSLGVALYAEWRTRFNHSSTDTHKAGEVILSMACPDLPELPFRVPPAAVADDCRPRSRSKHDVVRAYRLYYVVHKSHLHSWGNAGPPPWLDKYAIHVTKTGRKIIFTENPERLLQYCSYQLNFVT